MSEKSNEDDSTSNINHWRRRGFLAALAGSLGFGLYAKQDAVEDWQIENNAAHKPRNGPAIAAEGRPPLTEDEANPSGPHFPWEKDTVTITWREGNSSFKSVGPYLTEIQNAVTFWNDHISENTDETLSLEFDENTSNPDIEIVLSAMIEGYQNDESQYVLPSTGVDVIQPYVRVSTLTEIPEDEEELPIRGEISQCNGGINVFQHLAKHLIGRLIGYEIWSDPVDIMTPKRNFGIDSYEHRLTIGNVIGGLLTTVNNGTETASQQADFQLSHIQNNDSDDISSGFESTKSEWVNQRDDIETRMQENFPTPIEQAIEDVPEFSTQLSKYIEAYEETIVSNELAHLTETIDIIDELIAETENTDMSNEEIRDLDAYEDYIEHLETMSDWPSGEPADKRVHWHATDALWSNYNWSDYEPA